MHINSREEHDVGGVDGYYGSCCGTRVSTIVEDIKSADNSFHDFGAFFFWDMRLGKDHGKTTS